MIRWLHDFFGYRGPDAAHHAMLAVVEASLRDKAEWKMDGECRAVNLTRSLEVWVGNRDYGFRLVDGRIYGTGSDIPLSGRWKKRLWAAWAQRGLPSERAREIVERFKRLSAEQK